LSPDDHGQRPAAIHRRHAALLCQRCGGILDSPPPPRERSAGATSQGVPQHPHPRPLTLYTDQVNQRHRPMTTFTLTDDQQIDELIETFWDDLEDDDTFSLWDDDQDLEAFCLESCFGPEE